MQKFLDTPGVGDHGSLRRRWRKEKNDCNAAADHTRKVEEAGGVQQTQDPTKPNPSKSLCSGRVD
ncbi:hypothetical protein BDV39DRAFT_186633 [Aspergillus sergii]|uniref:Uncharacterized protein n=1 Tax=Aspergillus sergii TaxID=1034303 RepID=A0A5N6WJJ8_9EURO|nr:hypothetical protein BDV39DRAFT_186633 [Aspergillus sergii]